MVDILLCTGGDHEGDFDLTDSGDIQLGSSILQAAKTAICWIKGEWRLGPDIGLPWFDDFLVKNPSMEIMRMDIINALNSIEGVTKADAEILEFDRASRKARVNISMQTDDESYSGEVVLGG